jgi:hypothetical protein
MFLILTGVASTASQSRDGRDDICHRDGCRSDHPEEFYQYVLLISFDGPDSLREENQSQVTVTIENECNTGKSKYNTFDWVDLVLTSVNGRTTIFDETQRITNMGPGSGNRRTVTWTIEGLDPGSDTLFVDIHAFNSHERTNKYESGSHDIEITPAPPDISIQSIQTVPTNPVEGDSINFTIEVVNTGESATWNITILLNDHLEEQRTVDSPRNELLHIVWDWDSSGHLGDWTIRVEASGVAKEEDLDDNTLESQFHVMTRPDLEVLNISYDPSEPVDGEVVTIVAALRNAGEGTANFQAELHLDSGNNSIGSEHIILAGFEYSNVTFFWVPTKQVGPHDLIVLVDPDDMVNETDEGNNVLNRSIIIQPPPIQSDPSIHRSDIHVPDFILEGDNITINIAVRNLGNSSLNLTARILLSGLSTFTLQDFRIHLEPHEIRPLSATWDTRYRAGNWSVIVELFGTDPEDERTHNNEASIAFAILNRPDPAIVSIDWTPREPLYNSTLLVNMTFSNAGDSTVEFLSTIILWGEEITQYHVLSPGEIRTFPQEIFFGSPGNLTVHLGWAIPWERELWNNHFVIMVEAFTAQDFSIESFELSQPPGYFGDRHRISAQVSNTWVLNGTGKLIMRMNGKQLASFDLSIPAGENRTYGIDWIPTIGKHTFSAFLIVPSEDPVSGDDHHKRFRFTPGMPEPSLTAMVLSPTILVAEDEVFAHTIVSNSGETGTNLTLTFMVNGIRESTQRIHVPGRTQISQVFTWIAVAGDHDLGVRISMVENGSVIGDHEIQRTLSVERIQEEEEGYDSQFVAFSVLLTSIVVVACAIILREFRKGVLP